MPDAQTAIVLLVSFMMVLAVAIVIISISEWLALFVIPMGALLLMTFWTRYVRIHH